MEFSAKMCTALLHNKMLLKKYGITLGSLKENTLLIRTIPQCLAKSNNYYNNKRISSKIYELLNEILQNRHASTLPLTIHNAIASEACHGMFIKLFEENNYYQNISNIYRTLLSYYVIMFRKIVDLYKY